MRSPSVPSSPAAAAAAADEALPPLPAVENDPRLASLAIRCKQSIRSFPLILVSLVVLVIVMRNETQPGPLYLWVGLCAAITGFKAGLSGHVLSRIDTASPQVLRRLEGLSFATTLAVQAVVGSGLFIAGPATDLAGRLLLTLYANFVCVAALVNAATEYRSFAIGVVLNLGQVILFWLGVGGQGRWEVAIPLAGLLLLSLTAGHEQARNFFRSFAIRRENLGLAMQLAREKRAVEAALVEAREANEAKTRFLAAASHDLRQPLHAMTLFLGSLDAHVQSDEGRHLLGQVNESRDVLERQFNAMLDLSAFDAGAVEVHDAPFRLDALCRQLVEDYRRGAEAKGLSIGCEAPAVTVLGDAALVERMLRNLIDNAVKYTEAGAVTVRLAEAGEDVSIEVADTGIGIPEDQQDRVFDEYVQVANPGRMRHLGFGLGLAIVRRIDALIRTRLAMTSAVGGGTTFRFRLPKSEAAPTGTAVPPVTVLETDFRHGLVVWYLEDDPTVAEALGAQLAAWGCRFEHFDEPSRLIERMEQAASAPDMVFLDDMLGTAVSGLDVAHHLRQAFGFARICVLTGNTSPERLVALQDSGFPFLVKPASAARIAAVLRR